MKKCKTCSTPEQCVEQDECEKIRFKKSLLEPVKCTKEVCDCGKQDCK